MIFKVSKADVARTKLLEAGWYSWEIKKVDEPKKNKNEDGVNVVCTLMLIEHPSNPDLNGKEIEAMFGMSKGKMWGLELLAAGMNCSLDELEGKDIEPSMLQGKKIDGKIKVDVYEGRQNNKFDGFLPYKKAAGQQVPF